MKYFRILLLTVFFASFNLFAQLDIEISDGMLIETEGGLFISGASDVIENGSGYLKGVVESSDLSSATQFAGLTLSTGFSGTITRTTGTAISASNPKTALRSYEMDNSTSPISPDVSFEFISSGSNNESNSLAEKLLFTKVGSTWKGYSDNGSTSSLISAAGVLIPSGNSEITIAEGVGVGATIFLEGPYNAVNDNMNNSINGDIPLASPYNEAPRTAAAVPPAAVDWVLVELRSGTAASTSLGYRSAFVNADGNIINDNGSLGIGFPAIPDDYYLVVKHRNHLPVMSNGAITYDWFSN